MQSSQLPFSQHVAFFVYTFQAGDGPFTEVVEVLVAGTALAQSHLLHIRHQQLYLIVRHLRNLVQTVLCRFVVHSDYLDKCQIVQSFGSSLCLRSIILYGVYIAIMVGI